MEELIGARKGVVNEEASAGDQSDLYDFGGSRS
jgi:hypothetical protein